MTTYSDDEAMGASVTLFTIGGNTAQHSEREI